MSDSLIAMSQDSYNLTRLFYTNLSKLMLGVSDGLLGFRHHDPAFHLSLTGIGITVSSRVPLEHKREKWNSRDVMISLSVQ